jgi:hypothetical protein
MAGIFLNYIFMITEATATAPTNFPKSMSLFSKSFVYPGFHFEGQGCVRGQSPTPLVGLVPLEVPSHLL